MKEKLKTWLRNRKRRALHRELDELDRYAEAIERRSRLVMRELVNLNAADLAASLVSPSALQGVPRPNSSRAIPLRRT